MLDVVALAMHRFGEIRSVGNIVNVRNPLEVNLRSLNTSVAASDEGEI